MQTPLGNRTSGQHVDPKKATGIFSFLRSWNYRILKALKTAIFPNLDLSTLINAAAGSPSTFSRYYIREKWYSEPIHLWEYISVRWHYIIDRIFKRVPYQWGETYLTHIPVLIAIGQATKVKKVLEFGCGIYSTLLFLDKDVFPDLDLLDSVENYPEWAEKVMQMSCKDTRLKMHIIDGHIADSFHSFDINAYDIIFVDDAQTREERCRTIFALGRRKPCRPVIVIHDYDMLVYQKAARIFKYRYRFSALYPNTGVVWNAADICKTVLSQVKRSAVVVARARRSGVIPLNTSTTASYYKALLRS